MTNYQIILITDNILYVTNITYITYNILVFCDFSNIRVFSVKITLCMKFDQKITENYVSQFGQ